MVSEIAKFKLRFLEVFFETGWNAQTLSAKLGYESNAVNSWMNGTPPPMNKLNEAAALMGVEPAWLAYGVGPKSSSGARQPSPAEGHYTGAVESDTPLKTVDGSAPALAVLEPHTAGAPKAQTAAPERGTDPITSSPYGALVDKHESKPRAAPKPAASQAGGASKPQGAGRHKPAPGKAPLDQLVQLPRGRKKKS